MSATAQPALEIIDHDGDLMLDIGSSPVPKSPSKTSPSVLVNETEPTADNPAPAKIISTDTTLQDETLWQDNPEEAKLEEAQPEAATDTKPYIRLLICSKPLTWTSPVFRAMLNGSFAEARNPIRDATTNKRILRLPDDDISAMTLICRILHHENNTYLDHYDYRLLSAVAVTCDKYDFGKPIIAWLETEFQFWRPWTKAMMTTVDSTVAARALDILHMSFTIGSASWFRFATVILAYVEERSNIELGITARFQGTEVPSTLIVRMTWLYKHLKGKFNRIPRDALQKVSLHLLKDPTGRWETDTKGMVSRGDVSGLCQGIVQQLAADTAFLLDNELLSNTTPIQQLTKKIKDVFTERQLPPHCNVQTTRWLSSLQIIPAASSGSSHH